MTRQLPSFLALAAILLALTFAGASDAMAPFGGQTASACHVATSSTCCGETLESPVSETGACEICDNARCTGHHTFSPTSINRADGHDVRQFDAQIHVQTEHDRFRATTHPVPRQPPRH
jgi:hypothetical protein